jgi:ABC-type amino acid transport substrate-binding protein
MGKILGMRMMMGLAALAGGVCLWVSSTASARQTIELAAYTFPPYSFKDARGKYQGADIEITEAVFEAVGYTIAWVDLPFNRALDGARKGGYMGIAPCVADAERKRFLDFSSIPTAALERVFFKRRDRDISWRTYDDLRGMRVGACDYSYPEHFWAAVKAGVFTIDMVKSPKPDLANFQKLLKERIDILIVDRAVGMNIIRKNAPRFDGIEVVPWVSVDRFPVPFSFGLSKEYWAGRGSEGADLLRAYERELDAFVKTGKRNAVFSKYGIVYRMDEDNHIILE